MSFNHLTYDQCAFSKRIQESTDPLNYNLYLGKYEACKQCTSGDFTNNLEFATRADIESDLKGVTRIGSKCPSTRFPSGQVAAAPFTAAVACQGIFGITPTNLAPVTSTGLKPLDHYGRNSCSFRN